MGTDQVILLGCQEAAQHFAVGFFPQLTQALQDIACCHPGHPRMVCYGVLPSFGFRYPAGRTTTENTPCHARAKHDDRCA